MRITESSLRSLIRALLIEDREEKISGWKPPWEGGGSGAGGHIGDRHWADSDSDYDDHMGGDLDEADDGGEED